MQQAERKSIVIASVLKPVDDTRMYEKFAQSLADNGYAVDIIGQPTETLPRQGIRFHALSRFGRVSIRRAFVGWRIFFLIQKVKPAKLIITTPELLWVGVLQKMFFGRELYYDVWENYYWNILDGKTYPMLIRSLVAALVRLKELFTSPFVDKFFLAEKKYASELNFAKPFVVLENKLPRSVANQFTISNPKGYRQLVFTGTLSENTGIFKTIELAEGLHAVDSSVRLTIVGYCHLVRERKRIYHKTHGKDFIRLIGIDELVPHVTILKHIAESDFGIIIYPQNLGTFTSIPTKLYEYLALRLPIIIQHNPESHEIVEQRRAGIVLSESIDTEQLLANMKKIKNLQHSMDDIFWESDAKSLILAIS